MMKIAVYDIKGTKTGDREISDEIYGVTVKQSVLHQNVIWQQTRRRAGTASTKTRSEVRGGGRKPWKQKGTGRARAGTSSSPLWRHGGTTFGPKPKDWSQALPKRVRKLGVQMAMANRAQMGNMAVLTGVSDAETKTKSALTMLSAMGKERVLFVTKGDGTDATFALSLTNIPNCSVLPERGINVYDILNHTHLVVEDDALGIIEARLTAGR